MKKEKALLLDRNDLKPAFEDYGFYDISPNVFKQEVQDKFIKFPIVIFIDYNNQTRLIENEYGHWGVVEPLCKKELFFNNKKRK